MFTKDEILAFIKALSPDEACVLRLQTLMINQLTAPKESK